MNFKISRAFNIPRHNSIISRRDLADFWNGVEEREPGITAACGCYIFVLRNKPWYVGMAEKQTFRKECFQHQKLTIYNEALSDIKGRPYLLLIPKITKGNNYTSPSKKGAC